MNKNLILLSIATVALTGCDTLRHTFGLDHYQADEYSVPTTPPLSMPPDHNLRAPEINAQPTGYVPIKQKAQAALGAPTATQSKEAEQSFIKKVSANQPVEENIRDVVNSEAESEKSTLRKISNWGKEARDNLSGHGDKPAETSTSKTNPATTR